MNCSARRACGTRCLQNTAPTLGARITVRIFVSALGQTNEATNINSRNTFIESWKRHEKEQRWTEFREQGRDRVGSSLQSFPETDGFIHKLSKLSFFMNYME